MGEDILHEMEAALNLLFHTIKTYRYEPRIFDRSQFASKCTLESLKPKLGLDGKIHPIFLNCDPTDAIISANSTRNYGYSMEVEHNGFHSTVKLHRDVTPIKFCTLGIYQSPDDFWDVQTCETRELRSPQQPVIFFINPDTPEIQFQHRYRELNDSTEGILLPPLLYCQNKQNEFELVEMILPPAYNFTIPIPRHFNQKWVSSITSLLPLVCLPFLLIKICIQNTISNPPMKMD